MSMDPITDIPKDRKPIRPIRIVLLLAMTLLLYLLIANSYGEMADAVLVTKTS